MMKVPRTNIVKEAVLDNKGRIKGTTIRLEESLITKEPFYIPFGTEREMFTASFHEKMPFACTGPTGVGKTRFIEHMTWRLSQELGFSLPLFTAVCHEDLTASDLVGNYRQTEHGEEWYKGIAMLAVQEGGILYLDEINKGREDIYSIIFPLSDYRRTLTIPKLGVEITASDHFMLVIAYNPGYSTAMNKLKPNVRQRFPPAEFDFPSEDLEKKIISGEAGFDNDKELKYLVQFAQETRNLRKQGRLNEAASTRLLVNAAKFLRQGISRFDAYCTIINSIKETPQDYKDLEAQLKTIIPHSELYSPIK